MIVSKRETYKESGMPIGTKHDRLVVTAVDCVSSWSSFSFIFLSLDILVRWRRFLLIRPANGISEFWQPFVFTAVKPEAWHPSLLTMLFWCHGCLWTPMSFQPLSVDVSFSWHPYLLASLSLETFFSWHFLLSTPHSLDTVFLDTCVSFCFYIPFCLKTLSVKIAFPWDLPLSWGGCSFSCLSLGIFLSRHPFSLEFQGTTSYNQACTKKFQVLPRTTKLTSKYYFVLRSLQTILQVLLRTTKLARSASEYYFVEDLHKLLPGTTLSYKTCKKAFPGTKSHYKACTKYVPTSHYKKERWVAARHGSKSGWGSECLSLFIYLPLYLSGYLSVCLPAFLSIWPSGFLTI